MMMVCHCHQILRWVSQRMVLIHCMVVVVVRPKNKVEGYPLAVFVVVARFPVVVDSAAIDVQLSQ